MAVFETVIDVLALIFTAGVGIGGIALLFAHRMSITKTDQEKGENKNVHVSD